MESFSLSETLKVGHPYSDPLISARVGIKNRNSTSISYLSRTTPFIPMTPNGSSRQKATSSPSNPISLSRYPLPARNSAELKTTNVRLIRAHYLRGTTGTLRLVCVAASGTARTSTTRVSSWVDRFPSTTRSCGHPMVGA